MADNQDLEWLSDYVLSFLKSPSWVAPIAQFVDEQCIIFEDEEENKLEYTECHNEFRQLIDNLLAAHLLELDVSNEQFEQFCQTGLSTNSTLHRVLVEQLLAVDDFLIFKAMMTKRNADLYREAQRRVDAGQLDEEDFHETTVVDDDEEVLAGLGEMTVEASLVADEWKMYEDQLFQALDESQKADDELARQRQKEEEELERALVLSLQMEEERMHGLAGEAANASPSSSSAAGQDAAPPPPAPPPPSEAASAAPVEASAAPAQRRLSRKSNHRFETACAPARDARGAHGRVPTWDRGFRFSRARACAGGNCSTGAAGACRRGFRAAACPARGTRGTASAKRGRSQSSCRTSAEAAPAASGEAQQGAAKAA